VVSFAPFCHVYLLFMESATSSRCQITAFRVTLVIVTKPTNSSAVIEHLRVAPTVPARSIGSQTLIRQMDVRGVQIAIIYRVLHELNVLNDRDRLIDLLGNVTL
jgi:hypothetical protein